MAKAKPAFSFKAPSDPTVTFQAPSQVPAMASTSYYGAQVNQGTLKGDPALKQEKPSVTVVHRDITDQVGTERVSNQQDLSPVEVSLKTVSGILAVKSGNITMNIKPTEPAVSTMESFAAPNAQKENARIKFTSNSDPAVQDVHPKATPEGGRALAGKNPESSSSKSGVQPNKARPRVKLPGVPAATQTDSSPINASTQTNVKGDALSVESAGPEAEPKKKPSRTPLESSATVLKLENPSSTEQGPEPHITEAQVSTPLTSAEQRAPSASLPETQNSMTMVKEEVASKDNAKGGVPSQNVQTSAVSSTDPEATSVSAKEDETTPHSEYEDASEKLPQVDNMTISKAIASASSPGTAGASDSLVQRPEPVVQKTGHTVKEPEAPERRQEKLKLTPKDATVAFSRRARSVTTEPGRIPQDLEGNEHHLKDTSQDSASRPVVSENPATAISEQSDHLIRGKQNFGPHLGPKPAPSLLTPVASSTARNVAVQNQAATQSVAIHGDSASEEKQDAFSEKPQSLATAPIAQIRKQETYQQAMSASSLNMHAVRVKAEQRTEVPEEGPRQPRSSRRFRSFVAKLLSCFKDTD